MELPLHTRHLVERLLSRYCAGICPPAFEQQVRLGFRIEGRRVIVHELKRIFGIAGTVRTVDVARFTWESGDGGWRLAYSREEPARWRPYPRRTGRVFVRLLAELDADPLGVFWGRVNGASLRWCSARGRCAPCEDAYRAVLGVVSEHSGQVTPSSPPSAAVFSPAAR